MGKRTVNEALERIFVFNEDKDLKTRLTDEQIAKILSDEYPNSAVKTSDEVKTRRRAFNRGQYWFKEYGSAPSRGLPLSKCYDREGESATTETTVDLEAVRKLVRESIDEEDIPGLVEKQTAELPSLVSRLVDEKIKERPILEITFKDRETQRVDTGHVHHKFEEILLKVKAGVPVLLVGPTGSGKTHLCAQIAKALSMSFTFNSMSEGVSESALLGRTLPDNDGNWVYRPSPFVQSYSNGGVHLLDEIDGADPNLLVQVNAALANRKLSIPFKDEAAPIEQHEDSIVIAAANTYGNGADAQYVGRNQLDAATVNRFTMGTVTIDYDRDLERMLAHSAINDKDLADRLLKWCWKLRDRIYEANLRRFMSTRSLLDCAKLLVAGASFEMIEETYFLGWSKDEKARVSA